MDRKDVDSIIEEINQLNPDPTRPPRRPTPFRVYEELYLPVTRSYGLEIVRRDIIPVAHYQRSIRCHTVSAWNRFRDEAAIPTHEILVNAFSRARTAAGDKVGISDTGVKNQHTAMLLLELEYNEMISDALAEVGDLVIRPGYIEGLACFRVEAPFVAGEAWRRQVTAESIVDALLFYHLPAIVKHKAASRLP